MRIIKLITSYVLILTVFISNSFVSSANTYLEYDFFLESVGVPQEIIASMSFEQKELICQTIGEDAIFEGYDEKSFFLEDDSLVEGVQTMSESIPSSDLTISVVGFSITYDGQACYAIYPTFVWHTVGKIANDSFGMSLYSGWEAMPNHNNLEVYLKNYQGTTVQHTGVSPQNSTDKGYNYLIPSSIGAVQGLYEGHSYLYARKTNPYATHAISLQYVDDTSSSMNFSYSVNIGVGSLSFSPANSNLRFMSGNYSF